MTDQCRGGGPASRRLARRFSLAAASILPAAVLVLLPKCPFCLNAWLTVATGIGFSAAWSAWIHGSLVMLSLAVIVLFVAPIAHRVFTRASHAEHQSD